MYAETILQAQEVSISGVSQYPAGQGKMVKMGKMRENEGKRGEMGGNGGKWGKMGENGEKWGEMGSCYKYIMENV